MSELFHNGWNKGRVWECSCGSRFSSKAQGELHRCKIIKVVKNE